MADLSDKRLGIAARQILVSKLALERGLPDGYISDPVVGILLSLFIHSVENVKLTETELYGFAEKTPNSVSRRWLLALQHDGYLGFEDINEFEPEVALTKAGLDMVRKTLIQAVNAERSVRYDPLKNIDLGR